MVADRLRIVTNLLFGHPPDDQGMASNSTPQPVSQSLIAKLADQEIVLKQIEDLVSRFDST